MGFVKKQNVTKKTKKTKKKSKGGRNTRMKLLEVRVEEEDGQHFIRVVWQPKPKDQELVAAKLQGTKPLDQFATYPFTPDEDGYIDIELLKHCIDDMTEGVFKRMKPTFVDK